MGECLGLGEESSGEMAALVLDRQSTDAGIYYHCWSEPEYSRYVVQVNIHMTIRCWGFIGVIPVTILAVPIVHKLQQVLSAVT